MEACPGIQRQDAVFFLLGAFVEKVNRKGAIPGVVLILWMSPPLLEQRPHADQRRLVLYLPGVGILNFDALSDRLFGDSVSLPKELKTRKDDKIASGRT